MLFTGPGGSGKSRLFIEWCARLRQKQWVAGFVHDQATPAALRSLLSLQRPLFLVFDYAECRPQLIELLRATLEHQQVGNPRRIALLSRHPGDWWDAICSQDGDVETLLTTNSSCEIRQVPVEEPVRRQLFDEAYEQFAKHLNRTSLPPNQIDLSDSRFGRVLYLHMAALACVEGIDPRPDQLLREIVSHEERFWTRQFAAVLPGDPLGRTVFLEAARHTVAGFTLRGSMPSREATEALVARMARGQNVRELCIFFRWLYPASGDASASSGYLVGLQPDLLGEALVSRVLADAGIRKDYLTDVFSDADAASVSHGFVVLGRCAARQAGIIPWMERLLNDDFDGRTQLALEAALALGAETASSPLGSLLAKSLERRGTSPGIAERLERLLPEHSVSLREVAVQVTQLLLNEIDVGNTDVDVLSERSGLLNNLGNRLSALGRREEALQAANEATDIYRRLASARPDAFLPDLAGSLNNLGAMLSELGRREEALQAANEATEIYKRLASARPDAFLPYLAGSLNNLGAMLSELGRREEALQAANEATEIFGNLVEKRPLAHDQDFAISLKNLFEALAKLGLDPEKDPSVQRAVAIFQRRVAPRMR